MKRKWCVREDIFQGDNGLWWLNQKIEMDDSTKTPMTIALKNGNISKVIDVKSGGLIGFGRRSGY